MGKSQGNNQDMLVGTLTQHNHSLDSQKAAWISNTKKKAIMTWEADKKKNKKEL